MFKRILGLLPIIGIITFAQETAPVHMTVTIDPILGKNVPEVRGDDVFVFQGKQRDRITKWTALRGENAALELFILIDDASTMSLGSQLADIRRFIIAQPETTQIGVAYMHNEIADIAQNLTADHLKAAEALRLPFGATAAGASPYLTLNDLLKKWTSCCVRREVVMISSGADPLGEFGPTDPYVDSAIEQAQRAGVIVYAIYTPGAGHASHSYWQLNWGQSHLAQLAEETGGESYMLGFGPAVTFEPYFSSIADHLTHQYSVEFLANAPAKAGLVRVRFNTETPNAEIVAAPQVYVAPVRVPTGE